VVPNNLSAAEFWQIIGPLIEERLKSKVKREEQTTE
jgi:hypothetical protein